MYMQMICYYWHTCIPFIVVHVFIKYSTYKKRTHLRFCKRLLGVKSSTQNSFIYFELGRSSLQCLSFYNIIKYWLKLCHSLDVDIQNKSIISYYAALKYNQINWQINGQHKLEICSLDMGSTMFGYNTVLVIQRFSHRP